MFARRNTASISAERESIANEIRRSVQEAMEQSFGIEVVDLQLSRIEYSAAFTQSVEAAVRAKNDALQAENTVARIRYEGEQAKVQAEAQAVAVTTRSEGEARAAVVRARAEKEAAVLRAEGEAQATVLLGQAQASAVQQVGAAVAANPRVVDYETTRRWGRQAAGDHAGRRDGAAAEPAGRDAGPVGGAADLAGGHALGEHPAELRPDGRMVHDFHVFGVKQPGQSHGP